MSDQAKSSSDFRNTASRRLKLGAWYGLLAAVLYIAYKMPWLSHSLFLYLSITAVIVAVGYFCASLVSAGAFLDAKIIETFPRFVQRIKLILAILVMFVIGIFGLYQSIYGWLNNQAMTFSRHHEWIERSESPIFFWGSTLFYFCVAIMCLYVALFVIFKKLQTLTNQNSS